MKRKFKLTLLVLCLCFSIFPAAVGASEATAPQGVTIDQLQSSLEELKSGMATKEELQKLAQQQGTPMTQEELSQQLINAQKTRIGVLEGNISSLLTFMGVLLALFGAGSALFAYWNRKTFAQKVVQVELRYDEIKQLKSAVLVESGRVNDLKKELESALRVIEDLQRTLQKSKLDFDQKSEQLDEINGMLNFVNTKASRPDVRRSFTQEIEAADMKISELNSWLEGTLPHPNLAQQKALEIFGENVTVISPDESIEQKLSFFVDNVKQAEKRFRDQSQIGLTRQDYENYEGDPIHESIDEWRDFFDPIDRMHGVVSTQIALNPDKFIPKPQNEDQ